MQHERTTNNGAPVRKCSNHFPVNIKAKFMTHCIISRTSATGSVTSSSLAWAPFRCEEANVLRVNLHTALKRKVGENSKSYRYQCAIDRNQPIETVWNIYYSGKINVIRNIVKRNTIYALRQIAICCCVKVFFFWVILFSLLRNQLVFLSKFSSRSVFRPIRISDRASVVIRIS